VTLCLVTDRRRLVPPDAPEPVAIRCLLTALHHAIEAGVDLIQVRERDLEARVLAGLVREIVAAAQGTATRVVVNDRLDVAMACGADGVHLRRTSIGVASVRQIAPPPFIVGRSVHSRDDVAALAGADYAIAGTVFRSASKPDEHRLLGLEGLRELAATAPCPVLAIGGVTVARVDEIAASGAAGVAAIGLFMHDDDPAGGGCRARPLKDLVARLRRRFDTISRRP
jgi:thiamine-phosphate pyrophosphorylase